MALSGIFGPWQVVVILFVFLSLLLPLIALVDILRNEFTGSNKIVWVLVVLLFPLIGPILYFFMGPAQKVDKK